MELSATDLNRRVRAGFTLVELLIALALVGVVMALAWLILDSTRKVADEIGAPVENPLSPFWADIQNEFDRLMPSPTGENLVPLRFSDDTGLEMVSLLPGPRDVPLQTELHYFIEDNQLLKSIRTRFPPLAQTNRLSGNVSALRILALNKESKFETWPQKPALPLPPRISLTLIFADGSPHTREFYLPASYIVEKKLMDETTP